MAGGEDNPFARWSRRKQAARANEDRQAGQGQPGPADPETDAEASAPAPKAAAPVLAEGDEAAEPLPRLEDLTAESDLSAFFRKGVPQALKSAAMRRMWSLDPAIRDYVGPAEYAWDFNRSGSMRGFGALDPGEAVVDFLSKTARATVGDESEEAIASSAPLGAKPKGPAEREAQARSAPAPSTDADCPTGELDVGAEQPAPADNGSEAADARSEASEPSHTSTARPRHGGAMPS